MSQFHSLKVKEVKRLTPSAVAISFEVPPELKDQFDFAAGQYLTLKHPSSGAEVRRAYSLCSKPGDSLLTIGVKKVPGGAFSPFANEDIREGDVLEVLPPQGRFVFTPGDDGKQIIAFAAGSGITPIMSIVRRALEDDRENQVVLVYGNQSKEETIFYDELEALKAEYADRFFIHYLFSREKEEEGLFGRIDKSIVNYITKNKHKDLSPEDYFLCGPEPMIETVSETLKENGVAADQIHYELFTVSEDEGAGAADLPEGMSHLVVTLDETEYELDMDRSSLVLDAVLKAKIDAPYSCQGGVCSTCIARVTEGTAEMEKNQILTDSELEEGFILTCQAHPTSAVLKIDYDDI